MYPPTIVTSAWPHVVAQCAEMGVEFDPWQHGVGTLALGKDKNGRYSATVGGVVLSIPRQVGKTYLVGMMVIALCVLYPGMTVLWTAQRLRTSTKTFQTMQGMVTRKKIKPLLMTTSRSEGIRTSNGEQEIRFRNGSVIMFGARDEGFGRGFDEVDIEIFDEAQILTEKALEDMIPAVNQAQHPSGGLLFFMGTPPRPTDGVRGEEFSNRRQRALSGKSTGMVYIEFSADPGADLDDRKAWEDANPSFPYRTPVESMLRMRENLTDDDSFRREALGIWDPIGSNRVIPAQSWEDALDGASLAVDRFALGVEVGPDLAWASVALAGARDDGSWHVELDESRSGSSWVVPYVKGLLAANPQVRAVVVDEGSPSKALLDEFRSAKVRVTSPTVRDLGAACSGFLSGIVTGGVRHIGQTQLSAAAAVAGKRALGDTGMWVWSRKATTSDITPLQAATLALHGAQSQAKGLRPLASPASKGRVVVL